MKNILLFVAVISLLFVSCNKDNDTDAGKIEFTNKAVSIPYGTTKQLDLNYPKSPEDKALCTWSSSDETTATVKSGLVTAQLTGTANVTVVGSDGKHNDICTVTVVPTNSFCIEPIIDFSSSYSSVKSKETRTLSNEAAESSILYFGENSNVRYVLYTFKNSKLSSSLLMLANTTTATSLIADFLKQRYSFTGYYGTVYFFKRNGITVGLTVDDKLGLCALYYLTSSKKSTKSMLDEFEVMKDNILKKSKQIEY